MDSLIIQQIEAYLSNETIACANDGWIRVELLNNCKALSVYPYETILHALYSKSSNRIELSSFEPRCIRRRQSSAEMSSEDTQTVIVTGLPVSSSGENLLEFFNQWYPIYDVRKIPSFSPRIPGKIHVIFETASDAFNFVQQSKQTSIKYIDPQTSNVHPLVCQLLDDRTNIVKGKSFSTRLITNQPIQSKTCLNSSTCATEQILFCQNIPRTKFIKSIENHQEQFVRDRFSYQFYLPDNHLEQIHPCLMISALNPFCFTIQLHENALEFNRFQREINEFYKTINEKEYSLTPEDIQIYLCVICLDANSSNEKKIWNRSQILDYDPANKTVNLFYVDLGTWEEYVPIDRLRYLTERFHHQMVYSVTCRLTRIHPIHHNTWTDEATNQFLAVIENNTLQIEFLTVNSNGCFNTNLYISNSDQNICINDYLIHIKQARRDNDDGHFHQDDSSVHPVIALYNRFGEILQQSLDESLSMSMSNSSISSPSTSTTQSSVKLIQIDVNTREQQTISIVFVHYQNSIFIPDFNIVSLLKLIDSSFDLHTVQRYAFSIRYNSIEITSQSNYDIFTQLNSFINVPYSNTLALYPLDFVNYILKHYNLQVANIFLALENAQNAQLNTSDLAQWFTIDNELKSSIPPSPASYRLAFSNRLIHPI